MRSLSLVLPVSRSQVHLTSAAVNGLPSCHLTPSRNRKVSCVLSSSHDESLARSGTIDCRLFCGTSCLYKTRLLKTATIGPSPAAVVSSWIDMLAGLSKKYTFNTPPGFWAKAGSPPPASEDLASLPRNSLCVMSEQSPPSGHLSSQRSSKRQPL